MLFAAKTRDMVDQSELDPGTETRTEMFVPLGGLHSYLVDDSMPNGMAYKVERGREGSVEGTRLLQ